MGVFSEAASPFFGKAGGKRNGRFRAAVAVTSPSFIRPGRASGTCRWMKEGFFAKLTRRRLKNGIFHSVVDLQAAINRFIKEHNQQPRPFVWRANPNEIIAAVRREHQTLESLH